jgi:hypothetical protein
LVETTRVEAKERFDNSRVHRHPCFHLGFYGAENNEVHVHGRRNRH